MKNYISSAVSIENLRTQFAPEMDENKFKQLIELDPSADYDKNKGGKYCPWIFRQDKKGNLPESQYTNLKDALGYFLNNYKKYPKNDLGQYKTVDDFLLDTEAVGNRELTDKEKAKLAKKQAHHASDADKKFLEEDGDWEVWQPLTKAGSVSLARQGGTKARWCTAYEGDDYYWNRYTKRGPLYIFINTKDPSQKYQLHFESDSWYDIDDHGLGMDKFYEFCAEHPNISKLFEVSNANGVLTRADSIVGYDPTAKEITIPEGIVRFSSVSFPSEVTKIILPDSISKLREDCFQDLYYLTEVKLPDGIKLIPAGAFRNCEALETIDIPDSVLAYDRSAFSGCTSLKTINHSANLIAVNNYCFSDCSNLESQLPDTVEELRSHVFHGCDIASIRIPSEITDIVPRSFESENKLNDVDLNNVIRISASAFYSSSIKNIDLSKVTYIGANAFRDCHDIVAIEFNPEGVVLGPHAFADSNMSGVVSILPTTQLSFGVFDNCPELTIEWDHEDDDYEFENIKLLICSETKCPKLVAANKGYVKIETTEGNVYEVQ